MNELKPSIVITGASRGLGAAVAQITAAFGANIVLNARSADDLAGVAAEIREESGRLESERLEASAIRNRQSAIDPVLVVAGDVADAAVCQQIVEQTVERFGRIDALVNNAGVLEPIARIAEVEPEAWWDNVRINLFGPLLLTQAALPYLRESKGRVINVSTGAAVRGVAGWSAYGTSKAALNLLTMTLAEEEPAITAVAVRPGVVDTEMQRQIRERGEVGMTAESHRRFVQLHEEKELLDPKLPAKALAVLALHAPRAWSGRFLSWDDEEVALLVREEIGN